MPCLTSIAIGLLVGAGTANLWLAVATVIFSTCVLCGLEDIKNALRKP